MPTLKDVCRHVRSKNAGPYWITVDMFFKSADEFDAWNNSPAIGPEAIARALRVEPATVKRFPVPELHVLKISFPRRKPQGGALERDMHGGQQYVDLLDIEL